MEIHLGETPLSISVNAVTDWSQCRKKGRPTQKAGTVTLDCFLDCSWRRKETETPDSSVSRLELPYVPKTIAKISPPHFPSTTNYSLKLWTQTKQTLPSLSCFCEIFFSEERNNTNARLGWMGSDRAMTPSTSDKLEAFKNNATVLYTKKYLRWRICQLLWSNHYSFPTCIKSVMLRPKDGHS